MPYSIRKQGDKYAIIKKDTGEVVGHSDSKEKAQASIRARYANEPAIGRSAAKRGKI